jgi:hypothetical protein
MSAPKIEDLRFSSSSIDDFFAHEPIAKKARTASVSTYDRVRVANLQQLAGFQLVAEDQLVHLSQQDFWHLGKDDQGFYIEKLVDDDSGPVQG